MSYYFYLLEVSLKDENDPYMYFWENVSHVPTSKLVEVFNIDLKADPYIAEAYFLTEEIYEAHKGFIDREFHCRINLELFEYALRLYGAKDYTEVRRLYKVDRME